MIASVQSPDWLEVHAAWIGEGTTVLDGGLAEGSSRRSLLIVDAAVDLSEWLGAGTLYGMWLSVNPERGGTLDSGDAQVYSNIESDESRDDLYEVWYEHVFESIGQRWKVGKVDANGEFALVQSGLEFAQSSAGFSPTVIGFPTYPDSAYSVNVFQRLGQRDSTEWTLGYGLYDGSFGVRGVRTGRRGPESFVGGNATGDLFHVAEMFAVEGDPEAPDRRATVGLWHHDGRFRRADRGTESGTSGAFGVWEERFASPGSAPITVFGQFGWAEPSVWDFQRHLGLGARVEGPLAIRPDDVGGLYASYVELGSGAEAEGRDSELALDLFYRTALMEHLVLQPELHYVRGPSGDPTIGDAWIASIRVEVRF